MLYMQKNQVIDNGGKQMFRRNTINFSINMTEDINAQLHSFLSFLFKYEEQKQKCQKRNKTKTKFDAWQNLLLWPTCKGSEWAI